MRCPICGRPERDSGCQRCHFVHDHMDLLDATAITAVNNSRLLRRPAPWQSRPSLKADLLDAWESYPSDPHNLDNRTPERLESLGL